MEKVTQELIEYMKERNWDTQVPGDLAKSISIEAAEILEHFQWASPTVAEIRADSKKLQDLKMEIADVFIYLLQLTILFEMKPEEVIKEKLEYVKKKYPVDKIKASREEYYKIKEEHRKNNDQ
jgi:NTP pyrophosphatase (non-canonical NTP hydrolase)